MGTWEVRTRGGRCDSLRRAGWDDEHLRQGRVGGVINYRGVYRIGFRGLGCGGELIYCWLWVHCPNYMAE